MSNVKRLTKALNRYKMTGFHVVGASIILATNGIEAALDYVKSLRQPRLFHLDEGKSDGSGA
jgi:hypothetical protein